MSLWTQLLQLPPQALEKLQNIYGSSFPLEIRQYLCGWLEAQLINNNQSYNRRDLAQSFYGQLIEQIKNTAESLTPDNFIVKYRLIESANKISQIYASDPIQLYQHLCNCMEFEKKLLANPMEQINSPVTFKSDSEAMDITQTLMKLREQTVECEKENRDLKREYENICLFFDHYAKRMAYFEESEMQNPQLSSQIIASKQELHNHLMMSVNRINSMKSGLNEKITSILGEVEKIQQNVNEKYLWEWMREQKLEAIKALGQIVQPQPNTHKLDIIQNWFERQAEILWKIFCETKTMLMYRSQINLSQYGQSSPDIAPDLQGKAVRLLEKLIVSSFVVEKQPAQIIIKEKSGGGKRFSSTLRVLIGNALSTGLYNTMVNVSIISEQQAQKIQNKLDKTSIKTELEMCGEIVNSVSNLEYSTATNHLCAEFKTMQLKNAKRGDKSGDDKIVDEKYTLFFQANINVGELVFSVWTFSLPVVVISHAKQNISAQATIFWDNAFSELYRLPFEEPDAVPWSKLSEFLNLRFLTLTGRGLTPENLHFLCEKLMRQPLQFPIPGNLEISRSQFCKDFIGQDDKVPFTFWTWFCMALDLTREHLKEPWCDDLIAGFINKTNTERFLHSSSQGTFLLRFSESVLGGIVISWVVHPGLDGVKHLTPFVKQEFARKSISNYLRDLTEMTYLYINDQLSISKEQAFGKYMSSSSNGEVKNTNYVARDFKVVYDADNQQGSNSQREQWDDDLDAIIENAEMLDVQTAQAVIDSLNLSGDSLDGLNSSPSPDQQNLPTFIKSFSQFSMSPTSSY